MIHRWNVPIVSRHLDASVFESTYGAVNFAAPLQLGRYEMRLFLDRGQTSGSKSLNRHSALQQGASRDENRGVPNCRF